MVERSNCWVRSYLQIEDLLVQQETYPTHVVGVVLAMLLKEIKAHYNVPVWREDMRQRCFHAHIPGSNVDDSIF